MRNKLYYPLFLLLFVVSCEKYYNPAIDSVSSQFVVDAKITNDISRNDVHLTRTRSFYDRLPVLEVSGATVSLVEIGGKTIKATESTSGHYTFPSVPESGKQYFLRIVVLNNTYESLAATMPPVPSIDKLYTTHVVYTINENSGESTPRTYQREGREIDIDIPVTNALSYYRFNVRSTIEWTYRIVPGSLFPDSYGWFSYQNNEKFHLVGPSDQTEPGKIIKHPMLLLDYSPLLYFHSSLRTLISPGWILMFEQFGISKESYEFHQQLNDQFAATGSLFDPIQTQVYGNILCKSNPAEIVYGFFDLYSVKEIRYFLKLPTPPLELTLRPINRYPVIPFDGEIKAEMPTAENPNPEPLQPPDWWEE
ncbi:MAG: DUF4249 domain-containing protein [Prolixibacteraceae bacterium]|jgi:hypothetical protein|nr:DUF4249 domain-containing protein [Prolixibacteraceae bacterium]